MPKWGLSQEDIDPKHPPWDLDPDLLKPAKTITNSVQGDVYLTELERRFVDSPPFQRLRRVHQLGATHLIYPDATHRRFSHSLGALRVAQDLLDSILGQRNRRDHQPDLFAQWFEEDPDKFPYQVAEATVLARLGALLHDLCHIPFGHTLEDDLKLLEAHDENQLRFDLLWGQLPQELRAEVPDPLFGELKRLILSKIPTERPSQYPFVADLVLNTICADLLDYLPRDHQNLGLPLALGHRFLEGLYVTRSDHPHSPQRAVVEVRRKGEERSDVISELLKFLRFRYEESERALAHKTKLAADAMIGKALAIWRDALWAAAVTDVFPYVPANRLRDLDALRVWIQRRPVAELRRAARQLGVRASRSDNTADSVISGLDRRVIGQLEQTMTRYGDDTLLEMLQEEGRQRAKSDGRWRAVATLCEGVLNRTLYKQIARSLPSDRELAAQLWDQFGDPDKRRRLELEAARVVDLPDRWHLVLWIPSPEMKLKIARVLVGERDHVTTLDAYSSRAREIYQSHQELWAIRVFSHPDLRDDPLRREVVLAWLRDRLGLSGWVRTDPGETWIDVVIRHYDRLKGLHLSDQERGTWSSDIAALTGPRQKRTGPTLRTIWARLDVLARSRRRRLGH